MCVSSKFRSKKGVGGSGGGSYDTRRHPPKSAPVIGLVSMFIYICVQKNFVIYRTRDLIYSSCSDGLLLENK